MRIRDWQAILEDVTDHSGDPGDWRAVAGRRSNGVGEDLYVGHPSAGLYQLKTYARNPRDLQGVGTRVARTVDGDFRDLLPTRERDDGGRFAVRQPPDDDADAEEMATRVEETLKVHAEAPTDPDDLFTDLMDALDSPAFGPMRYELSERPDELDGLAEQFPDAERLLTEELDDLVREDGIDRGFE
jgi:AcrR family transcriptional regulator